MKKLIITLVVTLANLYLLSAKDKVIVNPVYDFSKSGITHVSKIEIGKKETRLHIHSVFIPGWWVKFPKTAYIEDYHTGKRWQTTGIINGEFDKQISMPASGDSTFILIFPPLDKSVTKINICTDDESDEPIIFGISLDTKAKSRNKEIPAGVFQWIEEQLALSKRKSLMDFNAGVFFARDTARLIGYIKGYDPRAGFSTGIIYASNEITREDFPVAVKIHEDGRFEGVLPMCYPKYLYVNFNRVNINFYIQPGQTLFMLLDWEEFRMADRLRNERYTFKNTMFQGAAAEINNELSAFYSKLPNIPYRKIYDEMAKKNPDEFQSFLNETLSNYTNTHQSLLETEKLPAESKAIIQNNFQMEYGTFLLDYDMKIRGDQTSNPIPLAFYDFLQDIPMDNMELLSTSNFGTFINRFEFCSPMMEAGRNFYQTIPKPEKTFQEYLFEELEIPKTAEDEDYLLMQDSLQFKLNSSEMTAENRNEFIKDYLTASEKFNDRHKSNNEDYKKKYAQPTLVETQLGTWKNKDAFYTNELNLKPGIVYDVTKIRSLDFMFSQQLKNDKEDAWKFLTKLTSDIPESFLKTEGDRLFAKNFPAEKRTAYELPDTYEAKIFKELIAPFKGKILIVDFWATSCGPCVYTIKETKTLREKYKDSPDVAFVFITSERESPSDAYDNFVKEQELSHIYRINSDQYLYLRQLFRFNGIPRYVLVDREGKIVDDNFNFRQNPELRIKEHITENK